VNIFFLTETESGCYKWRAAIPGKYLRRRGHTTQVLSKEPRDYAAPDVLVVYRAHFMEGHKIVEWCKKNSIRVVFDTDDALDLVPRDNVAHAGLQERMNIYDFLLEAADIVTTTTETLASYLRSWNPNVVVIPNSVDPEEWQPRHPAPTGEIRVGWSGSVTHFTDLALVLDAVREVQKKKPFTFVLQGLCEEPTVEEFYERHVHEFGKKFEESAYGKSIKRFLAKLAGIRHECHPPVGFAEHPRKVCDLNLDIGIAPLLENTFNQHKSCIKYYEYAMSGAITVASRVLPYSTEVPVTAKNRRDAWKQKLEWALTVDREPLWREQREWVMAHRNIEKNVELWERVLAGDAIPSDRSTQQPDPAFQA
jgi:glycosyltransferase involved in cell wall biosynthesis